MRSAVLRGVCLLALALLCAHGNAHPGGTDPEGCHVCRSHCAQHGLAAGERHCHGERPPAPPTAEILRLDYEGFTVWLDCARRGAVKFRYNAQRDTGTHPRHDRFHLDPEVPARCQQTSAESYKAEEQRYDRGHLVPANHLD